mmetsp:Transcript_24386/g.61705  ORF Transcript_24386/g.61705 Transcript_24386/m.61705 type:complete len:197 (-) Transcript_24386:333-923(-)
MDSFAFRQFDDPNYPGSKIPFDKSEFTKRVNTFYNENGRDSLLKEGYAPFCKHIFVPNFTEATISYLPITPDSEHLVRSGYEARNERELPVLTRWFPRSSVQHLIKKAEYLDVILYSREQVEAECKDQGIDSIVGDDCEWAIISIKAQTEDFETPMQPITAMRNALGKAEGGSGVPIVKAEYLKSVEFWSKHAILK